MLGLCVASRCRDKVRLIVMRSDHLDTENCNIAWHIVGSGFVFDGLCLSDCWLQLLTTALRARHFDAPRIGG